MGWKEASFGTGFDLKERDKLSKRYDYSSLINFYNAHNKAHLLDLKEEEAKKRAQNSQGNSRVGSPRNEAKDVKVLKSPNRSMCEFNAENNKRTATAPLVYNEVKYSNPEMEKFKEEGERYLNLIQSKSPKDSPNSYDKSTFPDQKIMPKSEDKISFDPKMYQKKEDFRGLVHDDLIIPTKAKGEKSDKKQFNSTMKVSAESGAFGKKLDKFSSYADKLETFIQRANCTK